MPVPSVLPNIASMSSDMEGPPRFVFGPGTTKPSLQELLPATGYEPPEPPQQEFPATGLDPSDPSDAFERLREQKAAMIASGQEPETRASQQFMLHGTPAVSSEMVTPQASDPFMSIKPTARRTRIPQPAASPGLIAMPALGRAALPQMRLGMRRPQRQKPAGLRIRARQIF